MVRKYYLRTARLLLLNGWALDRPVGAEYAAVARQGAEQRLAMGAFVEELAGVRRHGFGLLMAAPGASDGRFKRHDWAKYTGKVPLFRCDEEILRRERYDGGDKRVVSLDLIHLLPAWQAIYMFR